MAIVEVEKNNYTVEPLYQWDQNQVLEIRGLSLAKIPEIHFTNAAMDRAIVRQARMDAAGVVTVDVPNSLLQKPYKITVYVCAYEGATFKTLYKLEVPVKARTMPGDYTLVDDPEVYSFNALEYKLDSTVIELQAQYDKFTGDAQKQLDAYADTIAKLSSGCVLLWENPNPLTNFSAQNVDLDLSIYNLLYIEFSSMLGGLLFGGIVYAKNVGVSYYVSGNCANFTAFRSVAIIESGVRFLGGCYIDAGEVDWAADDSYAVPVRIWGLR